MDRRRKMRERKLPLTECPLWVGQHCDFYYPESRFMESASSRIRVQV